ncbi:S-layer homology domain-containing protein [Alkalicoccus chagannorensis]|uniref:S-layer homology domain-containing protein n=1 Tax=Alkalicoccus chagannorensis TaxID=427072 RepID=UPI00047D8033|nr:S-layer homology domain-containing protein [Alkalicoccus chagannorensis]
MMRLFFFSMLLLFSVPTAASAGFSDLSEEHPFYWSLQQLVQEDVMNGYPDGTIRPERPLTRAEGAVMMSRVLKLKEAEQDTSFEDMDDAHFAWEAVQAAASHGLMQGLPDGRFDPEGVLTREQMAVILTRAFTYAPSWREVPDTMGDVAPARYSYRAVHRLLYNGITAGFGDGTFRPVEPVSRGQFSAFLTRSTANAWEEKVENEADMIAFLQGAERVFRLEAERESRLVDEDVNADTVVHIGEALRPWFTERAVRERLERLEEYLDEPGPVDGIFDYTIDEVWDGAHNIYVDYGVRGDGPVLENRRAVFHLDRVEAERYRITAVVDLTEQLR